MSRSSKGFADFFPTAPAVLKARKKSGSPSARLHRTSQLSPAKANGLSAENSAAALTGASGNGAPRRQSVLEEPETSRVDLAHEVGSASSNSTTSSIFSARYRAGKLAPTNDLPNSTDLTPLTNMDSSPRTNGVLSPAKRNTIESRYASGPTPASPSDESVGKGYPSTDSDSGQSPQSDRPSARPGRGAIKGYRITYDPATDKSAKPKDKRNREAVYEPFGQDVRFALRNWILLSLKLM